MKLYLMTLLVLSSFLTYKAQGIRLGKIALSASNHQDVVKISSVVKASVRDDQSLAKSAKFSSGINRKLMTKITPASTTTTVFQNQKEETYNFSPENAKKHWKKDVTTEEYQDVTEIAEMDYTPARKKSPIHN